MLQKGITNHLANDNLVGQEQIDKQLEPQP